MKKYLLPEFLLIKFNNREIYNNVDPIETIKQHISS